MPRMKKPDENHNSAQAANTSVGLTAISTPPSAGPATMAICATEVEPAMARGSSAGGTMFGSTDCRLGCSNARPMPTKNTMARIRPGVQPAADRSPARAPSRRTPSTICAIQVMVRRS